MALFNIEYYRRDAVYQYEDTGDVMRQSLTFKAKKKYQEFAKINRFLSLKLFKGLET